MWGGGGGGGEGGSGVSNDPRHTPPIFVGGKFDTFPVND